MVNISVVTLTAPDAPEITVIPTYSYNNKTLLRLTTRFFNKTVRPLQSKLESVIGQHMILTRKYSTSLIG